MSNTGTSGGQSEADGSEGAGSEEEEQCSKSVHLRSVARQQARVGLLLYPLIGVMETGNRSTGVKIEYVIKIAHRVTIKKLQKLT